MAIPRFGMRALLVSFAVVAAWLATFSLPDQFRTGEQLRLCFVMMACILSAFAAVYSRAQQRAFWAGFFVAMFLLVAQRQFNARCIPNLLYVADSWAHSLWLVIPLNQDSNRLVEENIWVALLFSISAASGFAAAKIYGHARLQK